jgi:hypothetical protein
MITFFEKMIQTNKVHNREREKVRGEIWVIISAFHHIYNLICVYY